MHPASSVTPRSTQFVRDGGWDVIGISRSVPADVPGVRVLALDLTDPAACRRVLGPVGGVTHLVYAALQEGPGLLPGLVRGRAHRAQRDDAAQPARRPRPGDPLQHVSLLQGTKAYGVHRPEIGPDRAPLPLRERAPRVEHPNFYWLQEDELRARQAACGWGLTIFRPTVVYGATGHVNMNPLPAIAAYAALQRSAGEPLHFPGTETRRTLREAVDADLVARALRLGGDVTGRGRRDVQPHERRRVLLGHGLAGRSPRVRHRGRRAPRRCRSPRDLPGRDAEWAALVARHDLLAPPTIEGFVGANSLVYADVVMAEQQTASPFVNSTIAARQAGFADCIDTADMFVDLLHRMAAERRIPPLP